MPEEQNPEKKYDDKFISTLQLACDVYNQYWFDNEDYYARQRLQFTENKSGLYIDCAKYDDSASIIEREQITLKEALDEAVIAIDGLIDYHEGIIILLKGKKKRIEQEAKKIKYGGYPTYQEYLDSPHWQEVRAAALERADQKCILCYSDKHLHVHHRTYDRLGEELEADVIVLCSKCHAKFHDIVEDDQ